MTLEEMKNAHDRFVAKTQTSNCMECAQWRTWGIVEIAVRNSNVASYMEHWEGRALAAEKRLDALLTPVKRDWDTKS